ncbi:MAG TPA: carbamoyltransferase HypF [Gemmatimonadales bacterium]|nr:carbamoyltransferase HypF [Gemmatimonadales bacterium]
MVLVSEAAGRGLDPGLTRAEPDRGLLLHVSGVVQGVGFRPFVHRLARRHALRGWVRNSAGDVEIALEGAAPDLDRFLDALPQSAPPLAHVERIGRADRPVEGLGDFVILASEDSPDRRQPVPPDVALCPACERELDEPGNRRFHYPFITCTDCGPRYTVIEALPYDRERTTMRAFTQCPACAAEYRTPEDRRYHSETNSCPVCGPHLWMEAGPGVSLDGMHRDPVDQAARLLAAGKILALRGFGGFHIVADATCQAAVAELRRRKRRDAKPFAVMVDSLATARRLAELTPEIEALLASQARPIVLVQPCPESPVAPNVAPGLDTLGLMLPSTPLHHLLLNRLGRPLVMTSGNVSEEPIVIGNAAARRRLAGIVDAWVMHDREILSRCDDSVLRPTTSGPLFLRRARGFAPLPVALPIESPMPLLAVGPHLKNTFALVHGNKAYLSPHIGDLESVESLDHWRQTLAAMQRLFRIDPEAVVHDLHPGYLSTRLAQELALPRTLAVQHHHAHIAAVMAEHGVTPPVIGLAFDGTGYGDDGTVWGGEVLVADLQGYRRVAHLRLAPLPGGERAVRQPWRAALGYASLDARVRASLAPAFDGIDPRELALATHQLEQGLNAPLASSMGRLFDAAAAILGIRQASDYEGQAAMELEALAGRRPGAVHPCLIEDVAGTPGSCIIDPLPLLAMLGWQRQHGGDPAQLAADFHTSIAHAACEVVDHVAEATGLTRVALGGGVFQNARLLDSMVEQLGAMGLTVLVPRTLGPNDGAISYGQAAVAAARLGAAHPD